MANPYKNVSQEDFLQILKDFYEEHGRPPKAKEMKASDGFPSNQAYLTKFKPLTWNEILEAAGLPFNHKNTYTDQEAYYALKNWYDEHGRLPLCEELRNSGFRPSYDYYLRKFGTLENAYYHYGFLKKPLTEKERINISIKVFIDFAKEHKRHPFIEEYKKIKHEGYKILTLQRKLNMDYLSICRKYIPEYAPLEIPPLTKEHATKELTRIKNKIGRPPKYKELRVHGFNYGYQRLKECFDKMHYNQIIKSLGWKPVGSTTTSKTDDELLSEFEETFSKLGYIPSSLDLDVNKLSCYGTYIRRFGSIKNVCDLLDIDYDLHYKLRGIGYKCYDSNGGLCKSNPEMILTNFFIENDIEYTKEPKYIELLPDNKDSKRFDWKIRINDKIYYVEYFGMYSRNYSSSKILKSYRKKTINKVKKLYKAGVASQCIFVFPQDLKTKTLDEVFNFNKNKCNVA